MWKKMKSHWDDWTHPLRPNAEDVATFERLVVGEKRLLLGNTQELMHLSDEHADLLTNGYDWFDLPFQKESFDCIIGDGVFAMDGQRLFKTIMPYLKPGGKLILRVFLRNTSPVISDNFLIAKFQGWGKNYLPVKDIYEKYGDAPTCEQYKDSSWVYYFPDKEHLPPFTEIIYPMYPYGEFFPIVIWTA